MAKLNSFHKKISECFLYKYGKTPGDKLDPSKLEEMLSVILDRISFYGDAIVVGAGSQVEFEDRSIETLGAAILGEVQAARCILDNYPSMLEAQGQMEKGDNRNIVREINPGGNKGES